MIEVVNITLVKNSGPDLLMCNTNLAPSCYPWYHNAMIKIECAYDTGEEYVKKNFPNIPVNVIERV